MYLELYVMNDKIVVKDEWKVGELYKCPYCDKLYAFKGIATHIFRKHTEQGKAFNERNKEIFGNNFLHSERSQRVPWNKGLTKDTSEIVRKGAKKISENTSGDKNHFFGKKHSEASKQRISKALSINNKGGRCKWYDIGDQKVQGTWELSIAQLLIEEKIEWKKIKTNSFTFQYVDGKNRKHSYTPDFHLPEYNMYLEIKGYWWGNDKKKMELVQKQNPNLNVIIIEKELYNSLVKREKNIREIL